MDTKSLCDELRRVPMREGIELELLVLLDDPDVSAMRIARVVGTDPSLAARCLHLANSPYFGLGGRVADLGHAVVLLGFSVIRTLAVGTAAGLFQGSERDMPEGFWDHSVSVAAAASILARYRGIAIGDAFSAGLLHDIGTAILFRLDRDRSLVVLAAAGVDESRRCALERAVFGLDHAAAGGLVLAEWGLPRRLTEAIRQHHSDPAETTEPIATLLQIAETVAVATAQRDDAVVARLEVALASYGLGHLGAATVVEELRDEARRLDGLLVGAR